MKFLTKELHGSYENAKICYICKEKFENKYFKDEKHRKVRELCNYTGECRHAVNSICHIMYSMPKKFSIVFHNGSNYDYHFIIKELAKEYEKQFTCLGENFEKYITFTVPREKEVTRIDNNGGKITKNISYTLQFIYSAIFMASSLSDLVKNLSEEIQRIKFVLEYDDKKCGTSGIKHKYWEYFLEYTNFKDDLIECKWLCCNKNYQHTFDEKLKERLFNAYKFFDHDNNEFIYCCGKVFILMNIWMIGKNSVKQHYLKKKIFIVT